MRYQAVTSMVAVRLQARPNEKTIVTIAAGAVMVVLGEPDSVGLVHVMHAGEKFAVFQRDLDERAEIVDAESAASLF